MQSNVIPCIPRGGINKQISQIHRLLQVAFLGLLRGMEIRRDKLIAHMYRCAGLVARGGDCRCSPGKLQFPGLRAEDLAMLDVEMESAGYSRIAAASRRQWDGIQDKQARESTY